MNQVLAIAAGGAVGSVLRFWMSTWCIPLPAGLSPTVP